MLFVLKEFRVRQRLSPGPLPERLGTPDWQKGFSDTSARPTVRPSLQRKVFAGSCLRTLVPNVAGALSEWGDTDLLSAAGFLRMISDGPFGYFVWFVRERN